MKKFPSDTAKQTGLFISIALIWLIIGWVLRGLLIPNQITLTDEVKQIVQRDSPGEIPADETLDFAAAQAIVESLNDPFAVVIPPPSSLKFDADFAGETGVVGLVPNINDAAQLFIETVIENGPGDIAGVKVGDILISIDGIPVNAATTVTGSALLFRGPVGESVELVVQRNGEIFTFNPVRIERIALEWDILENGVGYIAQHTFTTNVPALFEDALAEIMATDPPAVIWDLRFNGGGSMAVAEETMSYFIEEGNLFQVVLKDNEIRMFSATGQAIAPSIPLVVLVNEFSFSAAETVAASIQELGRGTTVGITTFGKGTVQNTVKLRDDYLFEYTIGHWKTPTGTSYQGSGFTPTIIAPDDPDTVQDETVEKALEIIIATD
ncbi:S41 family peptidase [Candidatus Leptofilum sp.]|uniref:S41 family peptidase n=1 Tax=Candidatus Leptofilum sp. TaxID=3241576 RepID=UPI003B5905EB